MKRDTQLQATALVTLLVAAAFAIFLAHYESDVRSKVRSQVGNLLEPHWDAFNLAWDRRILLLEGLMYMVEANLDEAPQEIDENYSRLAAVIHRRIVGIRFLSIAPGGTVASVYPLTGNEMFIGHNLLDDKRDGARAAVTKTFASGEIALASPFQTEAGESILEAFGAIYGRNGFWGMVASAIEIRPLLKIAGFEELSKRLALAFRSSDGTVFWGDPDVFHNDPVVRRMESYGQIVEVGALPLGGWKAFMVAKLSIVSAVGILGILIISGTAYLLAGRRSSLIERIKDETDREIVLGTTPLENEPAKGTIFTAIDSTEQKHAGLMPGEGESFPGQSREVVHRAGEADMQEEVPVQKSVALQDVTALKQEREEREKLESQLLQAQKMESIGRLAGGVAHDFNNMLSVILGCTELIKARADLEGPLWGYLQEIEKAANRSREITRQLLAFSRKQVIAPRILKLNTHINDTQKILSRMIGEDLHLHFHPGRDLWTIKLDPFQLDQILMNLAVNARDAMPDGGTLAIKTANVTIDTMYLEKHYFLIPGDYVLLEVADEGAGMDQETLSHMFEPFFTTKKLGHGTGLGLATVYGIVKQNNGFVNVYSEPGMGTCFRVYFPRATGETLSPAPEEPQELGGTGTVLLVEDSQLVRELVADLLKQIGFTVLAAETPSEALSLCREQDLTIDILVTDVVMPHMNGAELGEKVAALRPGIKILFMSGYPEDFIAHRGILKEGFHFIQKPFGMKEIAGKIDRIIREIPPEA